ncbi:MAG: thioesterase family protein, partial [bacterium]|nr:thioesterase family protein [bacterium]
MNNPEKSELLSHIHDLFSKHIPFNKILGITVDRMDNENVVLRLNMRKELIGNNMIGSLHGGVKSSIIDTAGGLTA